MSAKLSFFPTFFFNEIKCAVAVNLLLWKWSYQVEGDLERAADSLFLLRPFFFFFSHNKAAYKDGLKWLEMLLKIIFLF